MEAESTRARYTLEFKEEAVRFGHRWRAGGARNLGLSEQTLHNWVKATSNGGLRVCLCAPGEAGAIQPVAVRSGKGVAPAG
jgi:transposase-like protein